MSRCRVGFSPNFFLEFSTENGYDIAPMRADPALDVSVLKHGPVLAAGELEKVDILIASWEIVVGAQNLDPGTRLAAVLRTGAGYESIDVDACSEQDVLVVNAPDTAQRSTATAALTLLLAVSGRLLEKHRLTLAGAEAWKQRHQIANLGLTGKTLGIVGLGSIGSELARLVRPLEMNVIAHDPAQPSYASGFGVTLVELDELFATSDIVSLHCLLTDDTRRLVDAKRLTQMKPSAILINVSRGGVVDQQALAEALQRGQIAAAGIDVFETEPPAPDDPLLQCNNALFSAHALATSDEVRARSFQANYDAVKELLTGRVPRCTLNPEVGEHRAWQEKIARFRNMGNG